MTSVLLDTNYIDKYSHIFSKKYSVVKTISQCQENIFLFLTCCFFPNQAISDLTEYFIVYKLYGILSGIFAVFSIYIERIINSNITSFHPSYYCDMENIYDMIFIENILYQIENFSFH